MTQADPLTGLVAFVAVARSRSFTKAAQRLGVTKSAVGKSIARLEERLGTKLFYRTTRAVTLTADGEAYLAACSGALDEIARAERDLMSTRVEVSGRLRIDMPASFGRRVLLPHLTDIARTHRNLHLTMSFNDRITDPIEEGFDLVIRFGDLVDQAGLVARTLTRQRLCICAAPSYLSQRGTPLSAAELGLHDGIVNLRRGVSPTWQILDQAGRTTRIVPPVMHEVGDGDAIVAMALAGLGLCQVPSFMVNDHLAAGRLVSVLDAEAQAMIDVHALWPQTRHLLPKVKFVVDALIRLAGEGKLE